MAFCILFMGLSFISANIATMLHKFFIHFSLIILFAFTQMGVATHEISHLSDYNQQNKQQNQQSNPQSGQDKQAPNHQCQQCISHADIESALAASAILLVFNQSLSVFVSDSRSSFFSHPNRAYSARAPPQTA